MVGTVICPACGRENLLDTISMYDTCSGCGAPLKASTIKTPDRPARPVPPPPPPPSPPQRTPPPTASPPYAAATYYQYPPQYAYPYPPQYQTPYPYPYPYPYAYAYPMAPPPSTHPGLYDRPDEAPRIDLGALVRVLFRPKEAFRDLYHHTDASTGFIVYVVLALVGGLFSLVLDLTALRDAEMTGFDVYASLGEGAAIVTFGIGIATSLALFIGVCYLTHALLKGSHTTLRPDRPKTIGLLGYAMMPNTVVGMITTVIVGSMSVSLDTTSEADIMSLLGVLVVALAFSLVGLIWSLWVMGHAASVANDAPWGKSAGTVFVAYLVVGMIVGVFMALIIAIVGLSSIQGV